MKQVWAVKHRDGWCALKRNQKPRDDVFQVETRCKHFICLPWGIARREPDCKGCQSASPSDPKPVH